MLLCFVLSYVLRVYPLILWALNRRARSLAEGNLKQLEEAYNKLEDSEREKRAAGILKVLYIALVSWVIAMRQAVHRDCTEIVDTCLLSLFQEIARFFFLRKLVGCYTKALRNSQAPANGSSGVFPSPCFAPVH